MDLNTQLTIDTKEEQSQNFDLKQLSKEGIEVLDPNQSARASDSFLIISTKSPNFSKYLNSPETYHSPARTFIYSPDSDIDNMLMTLERSKSNHLIGKGPYTTSEVIANMKKIKSGHCWGIEKNLQEDAQVKSSKLYHSKDLDSEFDSLLEGLDFHHFFESPLSYLKTIANELGTNAFYHTKNAEDAARTDSIFLGEGEAIEIKIGLDSQRVALSVKDHIGKLSRSKILASIQRGYREKTPQKFDKGAGLGLYMVYNHSNQVIVNTDKDNTTEVISIIDANKRYSNYKKRITSFHYYEN